MRKAKRRQKRMMKMKTARKSRQLHTGKADEGLQTFIKSPSNVHPCQYRVVMAKG
ncbi:hypothetical protein AVEN_212020-1, partial [Araneus ventricosus]